MSALPENDSDNPAAVLTDAVTPAFATESQAAAYLGETEHQLYQHRRRGTGPPFVMHGARVRYPFAELVAWGRNLPRFTSRAEAYAADPHRAHAAERQRTATARARKTRWPKTGEDATTDGRAPRKKGRGDEAAALKEQNKDELRSSPRPIGNHS